MNISDDDDDFGIYVLRGICIGSNSTGNSATTRSVTRSLDTKGVVLQSEQIYSEAILQKIKEFCSSQNINISILRIVKPDAL